jgi:hypothetical protein
MFGVQVSLFLQWWYSPCVLRGLFSLQMVLISTVVLSNSSLIFNFFYRKDRLDFKSTKAMFDVFKNRIETYDCQ